VIFGKEAILKKVKFSMDGLVRERIRSFNCVVGGGKSPTTAGQKSRTGPSHTSCSCVFIVV
jgi:hypothetical protein